MLLLRFPVLFQEFTETLPGLLELASPQAHFTDRRIEVPRRSEAWECLEPQTRECGQAEGSAIQLSEVLCFPLAPCALRKEGRLHLSGISRLLGFC